MSTPHQPASRSRHVWYGTEEADDPSENLPSELDTVDHSRFLAVSKDKLTVRYVGRGNHSHDVGAVRTNRPCPQRCFVYYYEVTVVDAGTRGSIAVGMADATCELNCQPGTDANSYSYHGDDGQRYGESERGEAYGPRFGAGDVIGCGLLSDRREIFFTRNGAHLGVAFSDIMTRVFPTIGLHSPGEKVTLNLGASPFAFDIESFARSQREARLSQVASSPSPPADLMRHIREYLLHFNYKETLAKLEARSVEGGEGDAAFAEAAAEESTAVEDGALEPGVDAAPSTEIAGQGRDLSTGLSGKGGGSAERGPTPHGEGEADLEAAMRATLDQRRQLRLLIIQGDIAQALAQTERYFPGLLGRHPYLHFRLRCQSFVELLRRGDPLAAVAFAHTEFAAYQPPKGSPPTAAATGEMAEIFALIAYDVSAVQAATRAGAGDALSPHPMSDAYREATVDCLNRTVLTEQKVPEHCALDRLLRQLIAVSRAGREANHGFGPDLGLLSREAAPQT